MNKHRSCRAGVRAELESLESRRLLAAGQNAFYSVSGMLSARGERDEIPIEVARDTFDLPGGRVLLSISVAATSPGRLDPDSARVIPTRIGTVHGERLRPDTARGRDSLALVDVGRGEYVAVVQAQRRTVGAYRLDVGLAGDADANHRVDERDLALISALQRRRAGRSGYLVDADVDRDGRIGRADLDTASRNLGASWGLAEAFTARLDPDSDPNGDLRVIRPDVAVIGRASPGATVSLDLGTDSTPDRSTRADSSGNYRFDVRLAHGENSFRVREADDPAGGETVELTVNRSDVVLDWNDILLDAIRADGTPPPRAARSMAIVHIAAYDAVNPIVRTNAPYALNVSEAPWVSAEAAAAGAAHRALVDLYPGRAAAFDAALTATLADIPDGPGESRGVDLGRLSAQTILDQRRRDGSDAVRPYIHGTGPGQWRPTPPGFANPLLSQWPFVTPFALAASDQFRPPGPPPSASEVYTRDFEEVRRLGRADSTERTAEQTLIARFWADGAGTATPPGHWNQIAADVARQGDTDLVQNARLFALLNIALADAGFTSWHAKYDSGFWRPITAIRETDGNDLTMPETEWSPLLVTPPFPSYTSGHSTFSGAASEVLSFFFGPNTAFTTTTDDFPGVVRSFGSLSEAAEEAGMSRIYGGIHFGFGNRDGLTQGRAVGRHATRVVLT